MLDRTTTHLLWLFEYLWPILLAGIYLVVVALPNDQNFSAILLFVAGAYLGNLLLVIDSRFLYPKYNELQTLPQRLITRSILFVLAYIVAAFFIVSSSGSSLGIGLVLGIGYSIWAEMVAYLVRLPGQFAARFLFQLKRQSSPVEQQVYVSVFLAIMVGLTLVGIL